MRLHVEVLERRDNPSQFNWTGMGGDNLWATAANWDQNGALPTNTSSVTIANATAPILIQNGGAAAGILNDMSPFDLVVHDSLTIGQSASVMGTGRLVVDGSISAESNANVSTGMAGFDLSGQAHLAAGSQLSIMGPANLHGGATIDGDGAVNFSFGTVTIADSAMIQNLNMSGGFLQGPGVLTIRGTMNLTGGTLAGPNTTVGMFPYTAPGVPGTLDIATVGAALNLSGSTTITIDSWTINDFGTTDWTQGDVNNYDSTVNVGAGFAFNISASGGTWRDSLGDGLSSINNAGTFAKLDGGLMGMPVAIQATLNSTSTIQVQSGSMSLWGGGSLTGILDIQATAQLVLTNAVFTAENLAQPANQPQGPLIIDGTTSPLVNLIIGAAPVLGFPSVTLQRVEIRTGAQLTLDGTFVITGESKWTGGTVTGPGTFRNEGTLSVAGNSIEMVSTIFQNAGILNWTADFQGAGPNVVWDMTGSNVTNDSVWNIVTIQGRTLTSDGPDSINNNDRIIQTGEGQSVFDQRLRATDDPSFSNAGSIVVQVAGRMRFTRERDFQATAASYIQVDPWASVTFEAGSYAFNGSAVAAAMQLRGRGNFVAGDRAVIVIPADQVVRANNFQLTGTGASLVGDGEFNPHSMVWSGGTMSGRGTTTLGDGDTMWIRGDVVLSGRQVENGGLIEWSPGFSTILIGGNGGFDNDCGTFDILNPNGEMKIIPDQIGYFIVRNGGLLRKLYEEDHSSTATTFMNLKVENDDGQVLAEGRLRIKEYVQAGQNARSDFGTNIYTFDDGFTCTGGAITLVGGLIDRSTIILAPVNPGDPNSISGTTLTLEGEIRGPLLLSTSQVDLSGGLTVSGATGQGDWVRLVGSDLNLHGNTLTVPGGGVGMRRDQQNRGSVNHQGGRIRADRRTSFGDVRRGAGVNDGDMSMEQGGELWMSENGTTGTFTVNGGLNVANGALMHFQLSNGANDNLAVNGHIVLGGQVAATFLGTDFAPGQEFTVVNCESYEGSFDNDTIDMGNGLYLQVVYLENTIALRVQAYS